MQANENNNSSGASPNFPAFLVSITWCMWTGVLTASLGLSPGARVGQDSASASELDATEADFVGRARIQGRQGTALPYCLLCSRTDASVRN